MFGWFKKRDENEQMRLEIQKSFDSVKQDFGKVSQWIKHFDAKEHVQDTEIDDVKKQLFEVQSEMEEMKNFISLFGSKLSKQPQANSNKQTSVVSVQEGVQTAVQTTILDNLSLMERAVIWALANSDQKLSYEDLAVLLGKDKSTVRGQINTIRQKSEGLIMEAREANGKKRLYIPEEMKQIMLKNGKVRVKLQRRKQVE
jgi:hypothetical protein